jgi:hypothetical protein
MRVVTVHVTNPPAKLGHFSTVCASPTMPAPFKTMMIRARESDESDNEPASQISKSRVPRPYRWSPVTVQLPLRTRRFLP